VNEFDVQARATGTNQFLDLDKQQLLTPSPDITNALAGRGEVDRWWEGLDIPVDSHRFIYPTWLNESGADLLYAGDGKIIGFDAAFAPAHGNSSTNWDNWDDISPEQVGIAVQNADWNRQVAEARKNGTPPPPTPERGGNYGSATILDSQTPGGPFANLLTRDQSAMWYFKTREGALGILQIVSFTNDPASAKIRYKLIQQTNGAGITVPVEVQNSSDDTLAERLQAALMMGNYNAKDTALSKVALDAAVAGNPKIAGDAISKMYNYTARGQAALGACRELAKHGLRKPAMEIAKTIPDFNMRDQALSELAGQ